MKEYFVLATCILPKEMLDWFHQKNVRITEESGISLSTFTLMKTKRLPMKEPTCALMVLLMKVYPELGYIIKDLFLL